MESRGSLELDLRTQFEDPVRSSHRPQHPIVYELMDSNIVVNESDGYREGSDQRMAAHHTDDNGQYERFVDVFREPRICQIPSAGSVTFVPRSRLFNA